MQMLQLTKCSASVTISKFSAGFAISKFNFRITAKQYGPNIWVSKCSSGVAIKCDPDIVV